MSKLRVGMLLLLFVLLMGCGMGNSDDGTERILENGENIVENVQTESGIIQDNHSSQVSNEEAPSDKLVSTTDFMEYYSIQDGDIPPDYLASFIQHRQLTEEMLGNLNYDVMVKKLYERGVTFGKTITELLSGVQVKLSSDDDFTDVAYVVINKDIYADGTDMCTPQNIILEVSNGKVYITENSVTDDYTTGGDVRDISEQDIQNWLQKLRCLITEDWDSYHSVEEKLYAWRLHIVKSDGTIIRFEGEGIDEVFHPGLEELYQNLLR